MKQRMTQVTLRSENCILLADTRLLLSQAGAHYYRSQYQGHWRLPAFNHAESVCSFLRALVGSRYSKTVTVGLNPTQLFVLAYSVVSMHQDVIEMDTLVVPMFDLYSYDSIRLSHFPVCHPACEGLTYISQPKATYESRVPGSHFGED